MTVVILSCCHPLNLLVGALMEPWRRFHHEMEQAICAGAVRLCTLVLATRPRSRKEDSRVLLSIS